MAYFPRFFGLPPDFLAADFFGAAFLARAVVPFVLLAAGAPRLAAVFFDAAFRAVFFCLAGFAVFSRFGLASGSVSATGGRSCPIAPPSTNTASDHNTWYAETSAYGMTCTVGKLRPERYTGSFKPLVRISTLRPSRPNRETNAASRDVFGASYAKRSITMTAPSRARALNALLRASARTCRGTYCA